MSRKVGLVLGVVLIVVGIVWFGQGMNWIGGSGMSGVTFWAIAGPLVAIAGVVLLLRRLRSSRAGRHRAT